jgi:hypothetical protein
VRRRFKPVPILAWVLALTSLAAAPSAEAGSATVAAEPAQRDVPRIGVNLGAWTSWGAEQLSANVLMNPGFEGLIDRSIVVVLEATERAFTERDSWTGRPDGFWAQAQYDVRTGRSAGRQGRIASSSQSGPQQRPRFVTEGPCPPLAPGDVVVLTKTTDSDQPRQWWIAPPDERFITPVLHDRRPGSPGRRALSLRARSGRATEIASYLDAIGDRAGALLPVRGRWRLSLWARAATDTATLTVLFQRAGAPPFLRTTIRPGATWKRYEFEFAGSDGTSTGILMLKLQVIGQTGEIRLDDVSLGPVAAGAHPFRPEVVKALQELRPGYIRDWQGQLGDTLANRLADPFARRPSRYRPGEEVQFGYSLPELLALCRSLAATPWIILPPTFADDELVALGRFLAAEAQPHDPPMLIEFGNENWNGIFRPGSIPDPGPHGEAAERAFRLLREGAGRPGLFTAVVNGQHANPDLALRFARSAPSAPLLAVAPYVLQGLDQGLTEAARRQQLFAEDGGRLAHMAETMRGARRQLAVAEINLHTVQGDAPEDIRRAVTAGMASGTALAKRILDGMAAGVDSQAVFALSGFDAQVEGALGRVPLWGIIRDLGPTMRWRPTGLATILLNRAVGGDRHALHWTKQTAMTGLAFRHPAGWAAVLISTSEEAQDVTLTFPDHPKGRVPTRALMLAAEHPEDTNEEKERVRIIGQPISRTGRTVRLQMPPLGLAVLLASGEPHDGT